MAGLAPAGADASALRATYLANLAWAAHAAAAAGRDMLIEHINPRDMPGYFLNHQAAAHAIVQEPNLPNLKVQFDLYHYQVVEGDVATKIRYYLPTGRIRHIQMASVPERHEPGGGELNYGYLFAVLGEVSQACGCKGWVGCKYRPRLGAVAGATTQGLGWMA